MHHMAEHSVTDLSNPSRIDVVRGQYRALPWMPAQDDQVLLRAWDRCHRTGLSPQDRVQFEPVGRALLSELGDVHGEFIKSARPHLECLSYSVVGAGCVVVLVNRQGAVIDRLGHSASVPRELDTSTRTGINLDERCIGNSAPSMAIADHQPYLLVGDGHYCTNLRKFFCVAAPIEGPHGEVLGALDVSSYDSIPNFDVMSLVADSAVAIENSLHRIDADHILFRFHNLPQWIDTPREGIVVVRSDGKIASANRVARRLLGHSMGDLQAANFHDLFECDLNRVFGRRSHSPSGMVEWSTRTGLTIVGRIDCSEAPTTATNTATPVEPPPTADFRATPPQQAPAMRLKDMEMAAIEAALERLNGNVTAVSRELGISRNTVYRRLGAAVKSQGQTHESS